MSHLRNIFVALRAEVGAYLVDRSVVAPEAIQGDVLAGASTEVVAPAAPIVPLIGLQSSPALLEEEAAVYWTRDDQGLGKELRKNVHGKFLASLAKEDCLPFVQRESVDWATGPSSRNFAFVCKGLTASDLVSHDVSWDTARKSIGDKDCYIQDMLEHRANVAEFSEVVKCVRDP